jgi:hypothetical protein
MVMKFSFKPVPVVALCGLVSLLLCQHLTARQSAQSHKGGGFASLEWNPPDVNSPLRALTHTPPCSLEQVLEDVGAHAVELTTNLENFTAAEQIRYQMLNPAGFPEDADSGVFDYVFAFDQSGGGRGSREYRTPVKGSHVFPASGQDTGQAALALIFLPSLRTDYEMSCEGLDSWEGQPAWVVRFQQRKDQPRRTLLFRTQSGEYRAMLKGRAWISQDRGQVLHIETNLMEDIPPMNLRASAIAVDYAPVEIQSRKLQLWLPQKIQAYWDIGGHRIMLFHTFSNFKLFSVDTEENIEKPKPE